MAVSPIPPMIYRQMKRVILWIANGLVIAGIACSGWPLHSATTTETRTPPVTPTEEMPVEVLPPVVVETEPVEGSEINTSTGLTLFFNQSMDPVTAGDAFSITPELDGKTEWLDENRSLRFIPSGELPVKSEITVHLDTGAKNANGMPLQEPVEFAFSTPETLKVTEHIPAINDANVDPSNTIVATFNKPVVPLGEEAENLLPAFSISPPAEGKGEWLNTATYIFQPDPPLLGGKTYHIVLNKNLTAADGMHLFDQDMDQDWKFDTASTHLVSIEPPPVQTIFPDSTFTLKFNQPMDVHNLEQSLKLLDNTANPVGGEYSWDDNNRQVTFTPDTQLTHDTQYLLKIPAGITGKGGSPIDNPNDQVFSTSAPLAVASTDPEQGELLEYSGGYSDFSIQFNNPVKRQKLADLIRIDPPVYDQRIYSSSDEQTIHISGIVDADTTYTVTFSPDLQDRWGKNLGQESDVIFKTSPSSPNLVIPILQYGIDSVLILPDDPVIKARVTNIPVVRTMFGQITFDRFIELNELARIQTLSPDAASLTDTLDQITITAPNRTSGVDLLLTYDKQPFPTGLYFFNILTPGTALENSYSLKPFLAVSSSINLLMKRTPRQVLVWAVDLSTQSPLQNETITLYNNLQTVVGKATTDERGIASFDLPGYNEKISYYAVSGESGQTNFGIGMEEWNSGIAPWDFGISSTLYDRRDFTYIYSDRPIYQPGQTVNFRLVLREEEYGKYQPPEEKTASVNIYGVYSEITGERPLLTTLSLPVSSFGTAVGSYVLPADALPGVYSLTLNDLQYSQLDFEVATYRKPEFEIHAGFSNLEQIAGKDIQAKIKADYYFGSPAGDMQFHWVLYSRPENLAMPEQWIAGTPDYFWSSEDQAGYSIYGQVLKEGDSKTSADGSVILNFPAGDLPELQTTDRRQVLTLEVTAQDESRLPVSARAETILHPADFYIGVKPETWMGKAGAPLGFQVQTVDWNIDPAGDLPLHAALQRVTWESTDPEGVFANTGERKPIFTTISSVGFQPDSQGRARLEFIPPKPGTYRLEVTGNKAATRILVWVSGAAEASWPEFSDRRLILTADAKEYQAGDIARILIPNPFPGETKALITLEKGDILQSSVLDINSAGYEYPLAIEDGFTPNFYFSVTLIGKDSSGRPGFRTGILDLSVEPQKDILNIEVTPQPASATPGAAVNLNLRVTDWQKEPVQGEFSVALVDQAVLALANPNSEDIVTAFYDHIPLGVITSLPLSSVSQQTVISEIGGKGGGGMGISTPVIRSNFQDTAYWRGDIETDSAGLASIQIRLPDNLTTWVLTVRGLTRESRVGEAETKIATGKDLLIRPVTPRFLVVGDHLEISAIVHNNTTETLAPSVSLQSIGFLPDDAERMTQSMPIRPGERRQISWMGTVQDIDAVEFVFTAQAGELRDSTRPESGPVPVLKYSSPHTGSSTGIMTEAGDLLETISLPTRYTPTGGLLQIELSPSLAAAIISGLQALKDYPSDMVEANLSRLLANVQTYRVLKDTGIESPALQKELETSIKENLKQILDSQNGDGGWGWTAGQTSQDYLSAYVLFGLNHVQLSGILVEPKVLQNAQNFLVSTLQPPQDLTDDWEFDRLVFKQYSLIESGFAVPDTVNLYDFRNRYSPWAKALLSILYFKADPSDGRVAELMTDLKGAAILTAGGAHWEETLPSNINQTTPILNTAMVCRALAAVDPASDLLNDAVRYLVANRRAGGGWYSSYDSAWTLLALNAVLKGTGDLQANYAFSASLNKKTILQGQAAGLTALSPVSGEILLKDLLKSVPNALHISRSSGTGRLYYRTSLQLHQPVESIRPVQKGLTIQRNYYLSKEDCARQKCKPIENYRLEGPGDPILVKLTVTLSNAAYFLVVEDSIPAGAEILNVKLKTSQTVDEPFDPFERGFGSWNFSTPQVYQDHIRWIAEYLPAGTYEITYRILPFQVGEYHILPAHAYEYYFPEFEGSSAGRLFAIQE